MDQGIRIAANSQSGCQRFPADIVSLRVSVQNLIVQKEHFRECAPLRVSLPEQLSQADTGLDIVPAKLQILAVIMDGSIKPMLVLSPLGL
jgi:hypothetical protein